MKPKSILDPSFRYVPSTSTDIRKTFARVRRQQRQAQADPPSPAPVRAVIPLRRIA